MGASYNTWSDPQMDVTTPINSTTQPHTNHHPCSWSSDRRGIARPAAASVSDLFCWRAAWARPWDHSGHEAASAFCRNTGTGNWIVGIKCHSLWVLAPLTCKGKEKLSTKGFFFQFPMVFQFFVNLTKDTYFIQNM